VPHQSVQLAHGQHTSDASPQRHQLTQVATSHTQTLPEHNHEISPAAGVSDSQSPDWVGAQQVQPAGPATGPAPTASRSPTTVTAMHLSIWHAVIGVGFLTTLTQAFLPSSGAEGPLAEAGNTQDAPAGPGPTADAQATTEPPQASPYTFDVELRDVVIAAVSKAPAYDWCTPGIPTPPVTCDALLVAHRFCLSFPPTPSAEELALIAAASGPVPEPRQVALIEHLALCVGDYPGSQHLAPILVIPHVSCLQLLMTSAADSLTCLHPVASDSLDGAGNVSKESATAGRPGAPELQLHVEGIHASLHGQQAAMVGKLLTLWPPQGQQAAQQHHPAQVDTRRAGTTTASPPDPLAVTAQIGAVSIAWDASPTCDRDTMVVLNWQQVQLDLQSTGVVSPAEGVVEQQDHSHQQQQVHGEEQHRPELAEPAPQGASVVASLGWQELTVSVCRHQQNPALCKTPSGPHQQHLHTPGHSGSQAGSQGGDSDQQGPRLYNKQLAFLETLAAQHKRTSRAYGASLRPRRTARDPNGALQSPLRHTSGIAQRTGSGVLGSTPGTLTQEALQPLARADNSIAMSRYFSAQQSFPAGRASSSGALGSVNLDASGRLPGATSTGLLASGAAGRASGTGVGQGSLPVVSEPSPWLQVQPVQAQKRKVSRHRHVESLGGSPTAQQLQLQPAPGPGSLPQAVSGASDHPIKWIIESASLMVASPTAALSRCWW
jgi:hypothetical protein